MYNMHRFHIYYKPSCYVCSYETVYCYHREQTNSYIQSETLGEIKRMKNIKEKNKNNYNANRNDNIIISN